MSRRLFHKQSGASSQTGRRFFGGMTYWTDTLAEYLKKPPEVFKKEQVASLTGSSVSTLEGLIEQRRFPASVIVGKQRGWTRDQVVLWLTQNNRPPIEDLYSPSTIQRMKAAIRPYAGKNTDRAIREVLIALFREPLENEVLKKGKDAREKFSKGADPDALASRYKRDLGLGGEQFQWDSLIGALLKRVRRK